jgi:hypothetical protein
MNQRVFNCGAANAPEEPNRRATDARGMPEESACLSRHATGPTR